MHTADLGIVGLGAMGQNLALNLARQGHSVAVHELVSAVEDQFVQLHPEHGFVPCHSYAELVAAIARPRVIILLIPAGAPVDAAIAGFSPELDPGDVLVDSGNSHFQDTERRVRETAGREFEFVGMGISGGAEGALLGPCLMPGGSRQSYRQLSPVYEAVAARVHGEPCVTHVGPRGAGHYAKMVHNGIEYADMQLIAETYDLLKSALRMGASELASIFDQWNAGVLESFMIEATARVLSKRDDETGGLLVDLVLDEAEHKGTGKWASQNALDLGVATPTFEAAVHARLVSLAREDRRGGRRVLAAPVERFSGDAKGLIAATHDALYVGRVCAYAQGLALLSRGSCEYDYGTSLRDLASIWRGGCVIRARLLELVREAYDCNPALPNLMLDDRLAAELGARHTRLREVVQLAARIGVPVPALSSVLAYYDSLRSSRLPANLIQAQRDHFGAHGYRRIDREGTFHSDW